MKDPRRWLLVLIGLSLLVSVLWLRRQPREKSAHAGCLVHGDCLKAERCLVLPKGDGFASPGLCVDPCEGDLTCPAQFRCDAFFESGGFLLPQGAKGAGSQAVHVCVAGARPD
ncbi:MAG: hypothetical protein IT380_26810 [Myxococcales bacterium]|nr:hypothetical protein [Myxococcales bacterium]